MATESFTVAPRDSGRRGRRRGEWRAGWFASKRWKQDIYVAAMWSARKVCEFQNKGFMKKSREYPPSFIANTRRAIRVYRNQTQWKVIRNVSTPAGVERAVGLVIGRWDFDTTVTPTFNVCERYISGPRLRREKTKLSSFWAQLVAKSPKQCNSGVEVSSRDGLEPPSLR